jgi:hypothetical protein
MRENEMAKTLGAMMFGEDKMLSMTARQFGVKIKGGKVQTKQGSGPLTGARAAVESVGQINSRFTVTRLALVGPFALALKKSKDKRELYLTIEGDGYAAALPIDPEKSKIAHSFVGQFNNAAAEMQAGDRPVSHTGSDRGLWTTS